MEMIPSSIKKGSHIVFVSLQALLAIVFICGLISPFFNPEAYPFISRCGLFFQLVFLMNVVMMFILLVLKSKAIIISLLLFVLGLPGISKYYNFNVFNKAKGSTDGITVGTFNMQFSKPLAFSAKKEQEKMTSEFEEYLNAHNDIDILCVQEYGWRSAGHVESSMDFPYVHQVENMTVGILSKYLIVKEGIVDFKSNVANTCIWADIKLDMDTIRIYSYHLESNRQDGHVPKVIEQESPEEKSTNMMLGIVKYYPPFSQKRLEQVQLIKQHAEASPYPVILAGDLNDTPHSKVYKEIASNYRDSFSKAFGNGKTIDSRIPLLRIDYLFSNELEVESHRIHPSPFSDHYLLKIRMSN